MPVQINEVIIRAVVDNSPSSQVAAASDEITSQNISNAEIADRVLEIMKEKNER